MPQANNHRIMLQRYDSLPVEKQEEMSSLLGSDARTMIQGGEKLNKVSEAFLALDFKPEIVANLKDDLI